MQYIIRLRVPLLFIAFVFALLFSWNKFLTNAQNLQVHTLTLNSNSNIKWTAKQTPGGDLTPRPGYPLFIGTITKELSINTPKIDVQAAIPADYNCNFPDNPSIDSGTYGDLTNQNLARVQLVSCDNGYVGAQYWSRWAGRPTHSENFDSQSLGFKFKIVNISTGASLIDTNQSVLNKPASDGVLAAYQFYQLPKDGQTYRVIAIATMRQNGCNNGSGDAQIQNEYTNSPVATPTPTNTPTPIPTSTPIPTPTSEPVPTKIPLVTVTPTIPPTALPTTDEPNLP